MASSQTTSGANRDTTGPWGGWTPSPGVRAGIGCVAVVAGILAIAGAIAAVRGPEPATASQSAATSGTESPKTASSSWYMDPLPETGEANVVASSTSMSPVEQGSPAAVRSVGD